MASMENRSLGRGRVSVPVAGLGTWQRLEAAAAAGQHRELIQAAITAGIRLFDTSPMYGEAERLLADGLGANRDQAVIADKVWTRPRNKARHSSPARWTGTAATSTSCRSTTWWPGPRTCRCSRPPGTGAGRPGRRHPLLPGCLRRPGRGHGHRPHRHHPGAVQPGPA